MSRSVSHRVGTTLMRPRHPKMEQRSARWNFNLTTRPRSLKVGWLSGRARPRSHGSNLSWLANGSPGGGPVKDWRRFEFWTAVGGGMMHIKPHQAFVGTLLALGLGGSALAQPVDLNGVWWIKDRSEAAPIDPAHLPFTADGDKAFKQNQADLASGKGLSVESHRCTPAGMPRMMLGRYPIEILQRPDHVVVLFEKMRLYRIIYMNAPHDPDADLSYRGDSVGHWEHNTLVVDTTGVSPNTVIDKTGIPRSDALHVVERFTLAANKKTLFDKIEIDDPKIFTQPVSFTVAYAKAPNVELMEDNCLFGPPPRDSVGKSN